MAYRKTIGKWKIVALTILTFIFLSSSFSCVKASNFEKNNVGLDYVSLTDRSRTKTYDLREDEINATTWTVESVHDCSKLPPGCICLDNGGIGSFFSKGSNSVICKCRDSNQVVNLKGGRRLFSQNESLSWEVKGCSKVVVHENFLSSLFLGGTNHLRLNMGFEDIPQLVIHEAAFTLSGSHETTMKFKNCDIENIPPKAFPSKLNQIKFTNCKIGNLSSRFISSLNMHHIMFENCTVNDVQTDAFSTILINMFTAQNTHFKKIRTESVVSGGQLLNWTDCKIDLIEASGITGSVARVNMQGCKFIDIQTLGFSVKMWSRFDFINNTFDKVHYRGIDLTQMDSKTNDIPGRIIGNSWKNFDSDFIVTGDSEYPFVFVENNTFLGNCSCGLSFGSRLSFNESKSWFLQDMLTSGRCSLDDLLRQCYHTENGTNDGFVSYSELPQLCSTEIFMCAHKVEDLHINPKLPNRLQLLAFLIGAFVLFMVVSLLLTLLVYMIRKQGPRKQDNNSEVTDDVPRKEFVKSLNHHHHGTYGVVNQKMTKTPSMPSRIACLEDVEMEDKGVQTLPTELSADILEGLKEKLSKPDSLWDVKETINHLYDLINVREQSSSNSSPPDVTFRNDNSGESVDRNLSTDSLKPLVSPTKSSSRIQPTASINRSPTRSIMSTFAQSPTRHVAVGPSPSNSSSHIYSELAAFNRQKNRGLPSPDSSPPPLPTSPPPTLCDYTEPQDYQTHIYAELLCASQNVDSSSSYSNKRDPSPSSSVIPNSPRHNLSADLNDLNIEQPKTMISIPTQATSNNIQDPYIPSNSQQTKKRPLPSIPSQPKPTFNSISTGQ